MKQERYAKIVSRGNRQSLLTLLGNRPVLVIATRLNAVHATTDNERQRKREERVSHSSLYPKASETQLPLYPTQYLPPPLLGNTKRERPAPRTPPARVPGCAGESAGRRLCSTGDISLRKINDVQVVESASGSGYN
ncbi:hypothetical protein EVAR_13726_1 [Eumeta japonica]|uniref:Uncharacterized protein n=1 Tax=Eumeta variegata TaxID=151549 RepID=A0A4C1UBQ4_EUMVA|nr:hypothetical protein EVAR_13726_1 [Eumeta japonica]